MAVVGRIGRTHGLRGQVVVNPETDFPEERFQSGAGLFVERGGHVEPLTIASVRFQRQRPIIGFAGIDTIDAAQRPAGLELRVPADRLATLPAGTFYRHDLVGCEVTDTQGQAIGRVTSVDGPLERSRLVIAGPRGEVMVPMVGGICVSVDPAAKRIVVEATFGGGKCGVGRPAHNTERPARNACGRHDTRRVFHR